MIQYYWQLGGSPAKRMLNGVFHWSTYVIVNYWHNPLAINLFHTDVRRIQLYQLLLFDHNFYYVKYVCCIRHLSWECCFDQFLLVMRAQRPVLFGHVVNFRTIDRPYALAHLSHYSRIFSKDYFDNLENYNLFINALFCNWPTCN